MVEKYVMVRMRREDFDRLVNQKKIPMERDVSAIIGKEFKIKNIDLFRIASTAEWDLGKNFANKIIGSVRVKKGDLRL